MSNLQPVPPPSSGVTDHTLLTNLPWLSSGHTFSGALKLGASDGTGLTIELPYSAYGAGLLGSANAGAARTTLGAQAQSTILDNVSGLATTGLIVRTGAGTVATRSLVAGAGLTGTNLDGVAGNPSFAVTSAIQNSELDATSWRWWQMQVDGTSLIGTGMVSPFSSGIGTSSTAQFSTGYQALAVTITNNLSGWNVRTNGQVLRTSHGGSTGATLRAHVVTPSVTTSQHIWFGWFTTLGTGLTPTGACCGICYDPARSANWLVFSYDGATFATADTGVAFATNTHYWLKTRATGTGVYGAVSTTSTYPAEVSVTSGLISSTANQYGGLYWGRDAAGAITFNFVGMDYAAPVI